MSRRRSDAVVVTMPRLVLREFSDDDFAAVHEHGSDADVVRFLPWGPNTESDTRATRSRAAAFRQEGPRRHDDFAVVLRAEQRLIGGCGLRVAEPDSREGFIGYALDRRHWGRGYATEAGRGLLVFGFQPGGLHRILATCDPANAGSARVLEKIGMRREGHLREHVWAKRRWRDSLLSAVLQREWRAEPVIQ
jgi:RimJ/RimL family protein N-acetyltransferase